MNRSKDWPASLLPDDSALQHEHAPRPLPLFLTLVRVAAENDPTMGRAALAGLAAYETAERTAMQRERRAAHGVGGATLRDCGGKGPPAVLIPSLINPPHVLDLDPAVSLADAIAQNGRRVLLLDWGPAGQRAQLSVGQHVSELLVPLLRLLGQPPALIGYCLGGTMAIAAANLAPTERLVTLATPWNFSAYPPEGRASLAQLWTYARPAAEALGALPMEVLQSAFWSLDPQRTVEKFAKFAALEPESPNARRFIALEDWANEGEPLPVPAARELLDDFFGSNLPGNGRWVVGGKAMTDDLTLPMLHCTASGDRITPAPTAPSRAGDVVSLQSGHVGMIVGSARAQLHKVVRDFLTPLAADARHR
ncbi:MAG TPA: alpha/beta hydrolase [Sphingomicrobium sp.]|nr:alpha/beta hydrolase [Sphingomicrobium sp.]